MNTSEHLPLYRDGRQYDALNSGLVADIPFYVEEAKRASGLSSPHPSAENATTIGRPPYRKERGKVGHQVLELACGTGRLTIPIAQSGEEVVGLDLSASMLEHARAKSKQAGVEIEFVEGDCRSFELKQKFALIFMAFNSMQHLHDHASLRGLFSSVRQHLAPGGRFIFDVFNPKVSMLARTPEERRPEREYEDPEGRGTIMLEHTMHYDDASQVSRIKWYFTRRGPNGLEPDFRKEDLHLRCFFPQELDLLVRAQGFEIVEKFGDFDRKPFASGQPKQVVVCRVHK
jgi:SAM-dependent methyltransferase